LHQELKKINRSLPAAVYLPFVNESMRNYAVLHIVTEEAKIFKTKERCPLMLLIECYRPTEIALEKTPDVLKLHASDSELIAGFNKPTNEELKIIDEAENSGFFEASSELHSSKQSGLKSMSSSVRIDKSSYVRIDKF
jgi:hypothetical protein